MAIATTPNFSMTQNQSIKKEHLDSSKYISDISTISTFDNEEYKRLHDILASPEQLAYFEIYLQGIHAHENLLFIEALSELRHEKISKNIETIIHRLDFYDEKVLLDTKFF